MDELTHESERVACPCACCTENHCHCEEYAPDKRCDCNFCACMPGYDLAGRGRLAEREG